MLCLAPVPVPGGALGVCSYGKAGFCRPGQLYLQDIQSLSSLSQLLAAMLPAGMPFTELMVEGQLQQSRARPCRRCWPSCTAWRGAISLPL